MSVMGDTLILATGTTKMEHQLKRELDWNNYNYYDLDNAKDIVSVAKHNNNIYFSSFYNGVAQIKDGEFFFRWNASNTNYGIDTIADWANDKRLSVCGLKTDNYGNLWGLTSSVQNPLFVKTVDDECSRFMFSNKLSIYIQI